MIYVIIGSLLLFGLAGGGCLLIFRELKKSEVNFSGNKNKVSKSVQEELSFEEINNGLLCLGNHRYRLYCEVGAINYRMRSDAEQESIELNFNQFITSLPWPVQIYIQSRKMDNSDLINNEKDVIGNTLNDFPQLREYGEAHLKNMSNLPEFIGINVIKKNFIVIPYDGAIELSSKLSDHDKFNEAVRELSNRLNIVADGLKRINIPCKPLTSIQIAELLFNTFNRDRVGQHRDIVTGELMEFAVRSIYDYAPPASLEEKTWDILTGLENMIAQDEEELLNNPIVKELYEGIKELKNKTGSIDTSENTKLTA